MNEYKASLSHLTLSLIVLCYTWQFGCSFTPNLHTTHSCRSSNNSHNKVQHEALALLPLQRLPPLKLFTKEEDSDTQNINNALRESYPNDYLITDSIFLPNSSRPTLAQAIANPRDLLAMPLILVGLLVSIFNICGVYNEQYLQLQNIAITFGFISTIAYMTQLVTGYNISPNIRRGIIDDATVNLYAAVYTAAVSWLALRTSESCPSWLYHLDFTLSLASVAVFAFSLLAPLVTLLENTTRPVESKASKESSLGYLSTYSQSMVNFARGHAIQEYSNYSDDKAPPQLSPTELLRARGLLAIGVLGCIFAPDALSFALGGQQWWDRIFLLHPSQRMLESSTSLFALFAVEASMISHRVGKTGAVCYRDIVPAFVVVCLVLAIVPCVCALYWLGDDVSYFSFYRE